MKTKGCGKKYNRINMRVTNEFLDKVQFLKEQSSGLQNKSITQILEYVLDDYVKHPLNHLGMMDLLDMSNKGKTFDQWKEKRLLTHDESNS